MRQDYVLTISAQERGRNHLSASLAAMDALFDRHGIGLVHRETTAEGIRHSNAEDVPDERAKAIGRDLLRAEDQYRADLNWQPRAEMEMRRRLFVFDMDSTLIEEEVIDELAKIRGVGAQVAAVTASAMRGEIDFKRSFAYRLSLLRGLPEEEVNSLLSRLQIAPGASRLLTGLKHCGCQTAIISGGFSFVARELQRRLGIDHSYTNELQIDQGYVTGSVSGEIIDAARKSERLQQLARDLHIPLDQVVAVGDGANDLPMLSAAGTGIAYRAKPVLRESAKLRISYSPLDAAFHLVTL